MARKNGRYYATSGWFKKKTEIGKIIGFSRSAVSKIVKRFKQRENIENKPRRGRPRVTRKQGEHALMRPNKKICVFSVTCQKNLGSVGRH